MIIRARPIIRGHWAIEHRLYWARDMDFDEDGSQIRTASGPRVMVTCATSSCPFSG
jgi:predicted transposase YbfD/YdcC